MNDTLTELTPEEKEIVNAYARAVHRILPIIARTIENLKPALKMLIKLKQEELAREIHRAKIQRLKKKRNKKPKLSRRRAKEQRQRNTRPKRVTRYKGKAKGK